MDIAESNLARARGTSCQSVSPISAQLSTSTATAADEDKVDDTVDTAPVSEGSSITTPSPNCRGRKLTSGVWNHWVKTTDHKGKELTNASIAAKHIGSYPFPVTLRT